MKSRHSNSLILVWRVAEFETRHLNAPKIEPTRLLLGLCKVVDLDCRERSTSNAWIRGPLAAATWLGSFRLLRRLALKSLQPLVSLVHEVRCTINILEKGACKVVKNRNLFRR